MTFTGTGTYALTAPASLVSGADWTFDGTGSSGITIKTASGKKFIEGGSYGTPLTSGKLTLKGLTIEGNGLVTSPDKGGLIMMYGAGFTFEAQRVIFKDGQSDGEGGCLYLGRNGQGCVDDEWIKRTLRLVVKSLLGFALWKKKQKGVLIRPSAELRSLLFVFLGGQH